MWKKSEANAHFVALVATLRPRHVPTQSASSSGGRKYTMGGLMVHPSPQFDSPFPIRWSVSTTPEFNPVFHSLVIPFQLSNNDSNPWT